MWVSKIKEEEKLNALPTAEEEEEEELEEEDTVSIKSFLNGISRSNTDRKRGGNKSVEGHNHESTHCLF